MKKWQEATVLVTQERHANRAARESEGLTSHDTGAYRLEIKRLRPVELLQYHTKWWGQRVAWFAWWVQYVPHDDDACHLWFMLLRDTPLTVGRWVERWHTWNFGQSNQDAPLAFEVYLQHWAWDFFSCSAVRRKNLRMIRPPVTVKKCQDR